MVQDLPGPARWLPPRRLAAGSRDDPPSPTCTWQVSPVEETESEDESCAPSARRAGRDVAPSCGRMVDSVRRNWGGPSEDAMAAP